MATGAATREAARQGNSAAYEDKAARRADAGAPDEHPGDHVHGGGCGPGVPLEKELKTLILNTSSGYMAAHVQGHRRVSLPKLKVALESEQASLASLEELKALGLSPGTVSAVLNPVWSLPHLVDRGVMDVDVLTTNNGTLTGYFMFKPEVLLQAPSATVDDLAELMDGEPDPELADEDDQYR